MPPQTPQGTTKISIPDFGDVTGLQYPSGIRQFCGIPYANLSKRWTRSTLNTSLPGGQHDGTQYGYVCPAPPMYKGDDPMVPVPQFPHFKKPTEDEFKCLNLNLVLPGATTDEPLPVMVWIHGGSFLFGSSAESIYDMVNLVTHSAKIGKPVVGVSINYRTNLFGFLASESIKNDLSKDGFAGVGNFGLTDQQTALHWVNRYISRVGGDPDNVTIFGESAGGMSVAHQIWAANPAPFRRAISMSGTLNTIPPWTLETHELRYQAIRSHLISQPESSAEGQLAQLRAVSQEDLASATCVMEGGFYCTGNPCNDGWYHAQPPSVDNITSPPKWLESYMIGDVKDEAIIFRGSLDDQNYDSIFSLFSKFLKKEDIERLFSLYNLTPELSHERLEAQFEEMAADGIFKMQNYVHAHVSEVPKTFGYNLDQVSTLDHSLKGVSYHAIDLLYVFMNYEEAMSEGQKELSHAFAANFISFTNGEDPWPRVRERKWMVYGPADKFGVKTEDENEEARHYGRMKEILGMGVFSQWMAALDYVVNKRWVLLNRAVKTE